MNRNRFLLLFCIIFLTLVIIYLLIQLSLISSPKISNLKFLPAIASRSNGMQAGQISNYPTPTPLPTIKLIGEPQTGRPVTYPADKKSGIASFTIAPPAGYIKVNPSSKELFRFESPTLDIEEVNDGQVSTNAIIHIKLAGSYTDLDSFAKEHLASSQKLPNYRLVATSPQIINGLDSHRLEIEYSLDLGSNHQIIVHELTHLFFKDGTSFLVKGYSTVSAWNQHAPEISTSLSSFKFN